MYTVEQIKNLIDKGELTAAEKAIEALLKLGPTNIEALKLKAIIFSQQGHFYEEHQIWCQIMELAPDDFDLADYFNFYYLEEKEKFYFTDRLPEGGRRFILFPRSIIESCGLAFLSCLFFLYLYQKFSAFFVEHLPFVSHIFIAVFVILLPWFFIIRAFKKNPGDIRVTPAGVMMTNRFRNNYHSSWSSKTPQMSFENQFTKWQIPWDSIKKIYVAHKSKIHAFSLALILLPKDPNKEIIEIELSLDKSIVKGRRFLVYEILSFEQEVEYIQRDKIPLPPKPRFISI